MAYDYQNRDAILAKTNGHCAYCGKDLSAEPSWHRDHITPRLSGGGNELANLVAACVRCNIRKGCSDAQEFEYWIIKKLMQATTQFFDSASDLTTFLPPADADFIIGNIAEIFEKIDETHPQFFFWNMR